VVERFYEANCETPGRCVDRRAVIVADIPRSSWSWFELQLEYRLGQNWVLTADVERGGSRGGAVTTAGIAYRW
jgi:hypothetical protein